MVINGYKLALFNPTIISQDKYSPPQSWYLYSFPQLWTLLQCINLSERRPLCPGLGEEEVVGGHCLTRVYIMTISPRAESCILILVQYNFRNHHWRPLLRSGPTLQCYSLLRPDTTVPSLQWIHCGEENIFQENILSCWWSVAESQESVDASIWSSSARESETSVTAQSHSECQGTNIVLWPHSSVVPSAQCKVRQNKQRKQ